MRIAILADTVKLAYSMANWMQGAGYESVIRYDGDSLINLLEHESVDALVLDRTASDKCCLEVLKWVRATSEHAEVPIIMLSQCNDESGIVQVLDSGADDCVVKPVREGELLARIRAQLRKYCPERLRKKEIKVGRYTLYVDERSVFVDGVDGQLHVNLSEREFVLAECFFRHVGLVVNKDELRKKIWGENHDKYDPILATYVSKLRNVLQLRSKNGMLISTVYGRGYRLEQLPQIGQKQRPMAKTQHYPSYAMA